MLLRCSANAGRRPRLDAHRLSLGHRVHRLEDVAQVDDQCSLHRPRRGVGAGNEPGARRGLEVLAHPRDGLGVRLADRGTGTPDEIEPRLAEAGVPGAARRGARDRPRHAAGVGHRLLQTREQRLQAVRGDDPRGRGAAQVQASALARLAQDRPRLGDVRVELAGPLDPPLRLLRLAPLAHVAGDVAQQGAQAIVDDVDLPRRRAIAQRRPDQEVDEQADDDPGQCVEQPHPDHAGVGAVAREQDDERRRGGGGRLVAQHARGPDGQRHQQHDPEGRRVDPEHRSGGEGEQHAEERGGDLLYAAGEGAIDGGVHRQQRRPRREERLREPEDRSREDPGEHRGARGLDEQERVAPQHGVPEPIADGGHRPGMPWAVGR
jgi:hypothetical protein